MPESARVWWNGWYLLHWGVPLFFGLLPSEPREIGVFHG
jgi:hypothetical protein